MKTVERKDICRDKKELTPEYLEKVKGWLKSLTWENFHDCRYGNPEKKESIEFEYKLEKVQLLGDVIYWGGSRNQKVIRFGEVFIVDSKYSKGNICICEHTKCEKGHKVLHIIGKTENYKNYSQGYFAVPIL